MGWWAGDEGFGLTDFELFLEFVDAELEEADKGVVDKFRDAGVPALP